MSAFHAENERLIRDSFYYSAYLQDPYLSLGSGFNATGLQRLLCTAVIKTGGDLGVFYYFANASNRTPRTIKVEPEILNGAFPSFNAKVPIMVPNTRRISLLATT